MTITAPSVAFNALLTSSATNTNYSTIVTELNRASTIVDAAVSTAGLSKLFIRDGAGGGQLAYGQIIGSAATVGSSTLLVRAAPSQANAQRVVSYQDSTAAEVGYIDPSGNGYYKNSLGVGIAPLAGTAVLNVGNFVGGSTAGTSGLFPVNASVGVDGAGVGGYAASNLNAYVANSSLGTIGNALGQAFAAHASNIYVGVSYAQVGANALGGGLFGYSATMSAPTSSLGSVFGTSHFFYIRSVTDTVNTPAINEHCAYVANARYDMTSGQAGRWWTTDYVGHGPIGIRPSGFSGVSSVLRLFGSVSGVYSPWGSGASSTNYDPTATTFGGASQPTNNASAAFVAVTSYGSLGTVATDAGHHETATTYPIDIAYLAAGSSGSTGSPMATQGYRVAFMSGGTGGNYGGSLQSSSGVFSRIGTGHMSRDHEQQAFYAFTKYTGSNALAYVADAAAGNSIFGTAVANPLATNVTSVLQIGDNMPNVTNISPYFSVNAANLPVTPTAIRRMTSFTVYDTGPTSMTMNTYAYRNSGVNQTGIAYTSFGMGIEHDAVSPRDMAWWMTPTGVGIGATNYTPDSLLHVAGTFHATGAATFDSTFTATGNSTLTGIVGVGRAPAAGFSVFIGGTLGSPASGNTQVLAVAPTVTPLSATSAYGVNVGMTVDTGASNTITEAASFRTVVLTKAGTGTITAAYGAVLSAPTSGATNRIAKFDGTTTNAAAQIAYMDKGGHLAFTSSTAPASSGLLANTTSVTCTGTNQSGIITVVTSNTIATASTVATITFAGGGMEVAPKAVMLTPADSATWALAGTAQLTAPQASVTATTFIVKSGSTSPAAGTYVYYYEIF